MSAHNRREGYEKYYELFRNVREPLRRELTLNLIRTFPCPQPEKSERGRKRIHSLEKLDFAVLDMTANNSTYDYGVNELRSMGHVWHEPVPSRKELVTHMQGIDLEWLDFLVAKTAFLCLEALAINGATAPVATDSSAIETTRYSYTPDHNMSLSDFMHFGMDQQRLRLYLKYHITAILGHQIILTAITTTSNVHDSVVLPKMLEMLKKFGFDFSGRMFHADRAYDSDELIRLILESGMIPNIPRRRSPGGKFVRNPAKIYRELATVMFNPAAYTLRSLIEGIFGAEEVKNHQLRCRFLREDNRGRFSKFRAISWNINVLERFMCANYFGIPIPSYGYTETPQRPTCPYQQVLC